MKRALTRHFASFEYVSSVDEALGEARRALPDLIFLDLGLPRFLDGLDCLRRLRATVPRAKIVALSGHDDVALVATAINAGAHGFVSKGAALAELLEAAASVLGGGRHLSEQLGAAVRTFSDPTTRLSPKERQVFNLLITRKTNNDIARQCGMKLNTVRTHRAHIMGKLGVRSLVDLIELGRRLGLLEP